MGENIQGLLNKIKSWSRKSEVQSYICAVSSVVGLLCFALSSSSNDLVGKWSWWKIVIYVAFSFIFCYFTWFSNEWQRSISPRLKGRVAFVLLMITNVYSFVFDEREKKKPDAYILISYAAFAIMSLSLCTLGPLGTDLLYFFCGLLLIQLMKINIWLAIVAGIFIYPLIKLSSSGDAVPQEDQDQDLESGSRYVSQVDPLQRQPRSQWLQEQRQRLQEQQLQQRQLLQQEQEQQLQEQDQEQELQQLLQQLLLQQLLQQQQQQEQEQLMQLQRLEQELQQLLPQQHLPQLPHLRQRHLGQRLYLENSVADAPAEDDNDNKRN